MDKIICVGKNYLDHAQELKDAVPEFPVYFLKPPSIAFWTNHFGECLEITLPASKFGRLEHECEIVFRLGAHQQFEAFSLGLDMTLRDLQSQAKKNGHPWEASKVFLGSALWGPWIPMAQWEEFKDLEFSFYLDQTLKQKATSKHMRFSPEACLKQAAEFFPLCPGDVFFSGTPAGVSSVLPGNRGALYWGQKLFFEVLWKA